MQIVIRKEEHSDFNSVFDINCLAFDRLDEARLVNRLRKSRMFIPELCLVSVAEEKIVGHILFTILKIKDELGNSYESLALAPMAVPPDMQKMGIGSLLVKAGLEKARDLGYGSVIVLGHEHYYPRFGFKPAANWQITAAFEVPSKNFMAVELVQGALWGVRGVVQYADEFAEPTGIG